MDFRGSNVIVYFQPFDKFFVSRCWTTRWCDDCSVTFRHRQPCSRSSLQSYSVLYMGNGVSQCPVHNSWPFQSSCRSACDDEPSSSQCSPFDIFFRIGVPMLLSAALGLFNIGRSRDFLGWSNSRLHITRQNKAAVYLCLCVKIGIYCRFPYYKPFGSSVVWWKTTLDPNHLLSPSCCTQYIVRSLTPRISRDAICCYSVEGFQCNLPQIFIMWVGTAEKASRSKVKVIIFNNRPRIRIRTR